MLIELEIPDNFKEHYNQDKFCDSLKRVEYDIKPCLVDYEKDDKNKIYLSGLYEVELVQMLIEAFNKSKVYTTYGYDVVERYRGGGRMSNEEFEAEMNRQMDDLGIPEPQNVLISPEQAKRLNLTDKDKEVADKAAKLIARDYGEVIKELEDE